MLNGKVEMGPFRINPGKLSVSRSFGDVEAKLEAAGGKPNVLSYLPEVSCFKIKPDTDFILLGCDGIFDKLTNSDVIHAIWAMANENSASDNINDHCAKCVDNIIRNSLALQATDNLTCILIAFDNFKNTIFPVVNIPSNIHKHHESVKDKLRKLHDSQFKIKKDESSSVYLDTSTSNANNNLNLSKIESKNDSRNRINNKPNSRNSGNMNTQSSKNNRSQSPLIQNNNIVVKNLNLNLNMNIPGGGIISAIGTHGVNTTTNSGNKLNSILTNSINDKLMSKLNTNTPKQRVTSRSKRTLIETEVKTKSNLPLLKQSLWKK